MSHYNIALVPTIEIQKKAIALSEQLQNDGGAFVLGEKNNIPHVTLSHFACETYAQAEQICDQVMKMFATQREINFRHTETINYKGWIIVECEVTPELKDLHEKIVQIIKESGCEPTSHVLERYHPHITLSRFIDVHKDIDLHEMNKEDLTHVTSHIGLFDLGEHGECVRYKKNFQKNV